MAIIDFIELENLTEFEKKSFIEDLVDLICDEFLDLDMEIPISYDTSHFTTETTLAMAFVGDEEEPMLFIRPDLPLTPPTVFLVAHELRHIYQFYEMELFEQFENYHAANELSTEEYNQQFIEIDANAFGYICMVALTDCKPVMNGFSEELKQKVLERKEEILKEEFIQL